MAKVVRCSLNMASLITNLCSSRFLFLGIAIKKRHLAIQTELVSKT